MAKILVADDEPAVLDVVKEALADHEVATAANGKEAVSKAKADPPDLIILDIQMPVMDGLAALKAIKRDPQLRNIPVLMLTGAGGMGTIEDSFEARADDYIVKPFSLKVLKARIEELLKKKKPA